MIRSPLIGRDTVLAELVALHHAAARGSGAIVLLWGEAGVGKTRLLDEFALTIPRERPVARATCIAGLCPPFAPLSEAFAALALPVPFEAEPTPADASEAGRYRAFVRAAESLAGASALQIFLLDDLQWADFGTLEFLTFLARRVESLPVLVLAAVRSEDLESDHARFEALNKLVRGGARRCGVDPLSFDETRRLVSLLWPDGGDRTGEIERICTLAEGKPYFAEELVNSATLLVETSRVDPAPLSIRAGVLARFERLDPDDRRLLLQAAVIGATFDHGVLARLAGSDDACVLSALARARDRQLVRESDVAGSFAFRHAITREILYRELLLAQRQEVHRNLAALLESAQPPGDVAHIAHHWNAAGEYERATRTHELAGDRAAMRNAHRDAEDDYRRAVESRDDGDPGFPALCKKFSRALSINGHIEEACTYLERAVDGYASAGNAAKAAQLSTRLARRYFETGRPERAREAAGRSLRLCDGRGRNAFDAYVTLAHFAALQGNETVAGEHLGAAQRVAGEREPKQELDFYMVRALVQAESGRLAGAFPDYERAISMARTLGDPEQLTWTLNNYGSRALATGHTARAIDAYREAVAIATEFGKVGAMVTTGLASAYLMSGDLTAARTVRARARSGIAGVALTQSATIAMELRLAYLTDEALPPLPYSLDETVTVAFATGETQNIGLLGGCLAAYYDATGRPREAAALRSRALGAISSTFLSFWLLDQAASSENAQERAYARKLLAAAASDAENLAARAHLALFDARVARSARQSVRAKALADEAATLFAAITWPWERAAALEVGGRYAEAREIYRRHAYRRQLRELEARRRRVRHRAAADHLTPRELEVVALAAAGKSNREIAEQLFISERTVETHIAAVFDRFDLKSRRELAPLAGRTAT